MGGPGASFGDHDNVLEPVRGGGHTTLSVCQMRRVVHFSIDQRVTLPPQEFYHSFQEGGPPPR